MRRPYRLTKENRAPTRENIRQGAINTNHAKLLSQLRRAWFEAPTKDSKQVFVVRFAANEDRSLRALEAFRAEMSKYQVTWERHHDSVYEVTVA